MGLIGPVPARVDAYVKAALLSVVAAAVAGGWSAARACRLLQLNPLRMARWRAREAVGALVDRRPGGNPVHALLPAEITAILTIAGQWADIDRSHRKLAHRGSYLGLVWVSPSTLRRVLAGHGVALPARPVRAKPKRKPLPDWLEYRPRQLWIWDVTHFTRAGCCAYAIIDMVSRKWIATLVSVEETSTQTEVVFTRALEQEGLLALIEARHDGRVDLATDDESRPVLLAMSDNGPQMTSGSTREFMALHHIAQYFGRPGVPTDQAWVETFFGHLKVEFPHLEQIEDIAVLRGELDRLQVQYNTVRLHEAIGYVTPDDEHNGRGPAIRKARRDGLDQARQTRIDYHRQQRHDNPPDGTEDAA